MTSTTQLWKEPVYDREPPSVLKTAPRAPGLPPHNKYGEDVHVALLSVGGVVSPDAKNLSPDNIANKAWLLYKQPRGKWEREQPIDE